MAFTALDPNLKKYITASTIVPKPIKAHTKFDKVVFDCIDGLVTKQLTPNKKNGTYKIEKDFISGKRIQYGKVKEGKLIPIQQITEFNALKRGRPLGEDFKPDKRFKHNSYKFTIDNTAKVPVKGYIISNS